MLKCTVALNKKMNQNNYQPASREININLLNLTIKIDNKSTNELSEILNNIRKNMKKMTIDFLTQATNTNKKNKKKQINKQLLCNQK